MVNFYDLREELDKELINCDPFFQEYENRLVVFMYVLHICEKQLGKKKKYNFSVTKRNKDEIMIDIISSRDRLKNPPVLTKRKIKSYAKGLFLPE